MIEMKRRSFIAGLFIVPLYPSLALAEPIVEIPESMDLSRVHIWKVSLKDGFSRIEELNASHEKSFRSPMSKESPTILRDLVNMGKDWLNETAYENNDAFYQLRTRQHFDNHLRPNYEKRTIYQYSIICDNRNHKESDIDAQAKFVDVKIQGFAMADLYGLRFGYDPRLV